MSPGVGDRWKHDARIAGYEPVAVGC